MSTEIVVALYSLLGVVVGGIISATVSFLTTKQQMSVSLKEQKIEMLQRKISKLEELNKTYTALIVAPDPTSTPDQINGLAIDTYINSSKAFCNLGYFFPKEYVDKVQSLSDEVSGYIYAVRMRLPINDEKVRVSLVNVDHQKKEISALIRDLLREKQSELDKMY